jgi:hypothetical protein
VHATRAAKLLPAILIALAAVAFLRAEQLKLEHGPIGHPHVRQVFSPACAGQNGCHDQALLSFRLRHAQPVGLDVIDSNGETVRTLREASHAPSGTLRARWDGKTDDGSQAPDGEYRLQVHLPDAGRTITIPDRMVLDTVPPGVDMGRVQHLDGRVVIHFLTTEPSTRYVVVSKDGKEISRHQTRPDSAHVNLHGLQPGSYDVTIYAVDRAGNRTPNPPHVAVKVP